VGLKIQHNKSQTHEIDKAERSDWAIIFDEAPDGDAVVASRPSVAGAGWVWDGIRLPPRQNSELARNPSVSGGRRDLSQRELRDHGEFSDQICERTRLKFPPRIPSICLSV
jgi:hypothetical protein